MKLADNLGDVAAAAIDSPQSPAHDRSASSGLLDAVFANSREAVIVVDETGGIVYITPGAALLTGHDPSSSIGTSVFDYLHIDDVDAAAQLFVQRLGYDGADFGHGIRLRSSSGDWIETVATVAMLTDAEFGACAITLRTPGADDFVERSLRSQVIVGEYTNRLSAELMEVSTSSDVLTRIAESCGQVGMLTGAEAVEVYLEDERDASIERLTGWMSPERQAFAERTPTVDGPIGTLFDQSHVIDHVRPSIGAEIARFATQVGAVSVLSAPFRVGTQRAAFVLLRMTPGPDWIVADVELAHGAANLFGRALHTARSEELLALTYRQGPLGFSIRTWCGDLIDCNQQYLDLYGLTRTEADQTSLTELVGDEQGREILTLLDEMIRGDTSAVRITVELTRRDGSRFWAHTHAVPLHVPGRSESLVLTSVEDVTEIHVQRIELEHAARHDSLTGIANRAAMGEAIDRFSLANARLPAVVLVDVDHFKLINDSFGHDVGDEVLRAVAQRISDQLGALDVVARLGGDEFAIVIQHLSHDAAADLAGRLRQALASPLEVTEHSVLTTISIGIALGEDSRDQVDLLKRADRALYAAKEAGRDTFVVFDDALEDELLAQQTLEHEMREGLASGQFEMHFQPEFSLVDGRILGVEALIRWIHPHRGLIPPDQFIPAAERSGLIDEVGRFALFEACSSFMAIPEMDGLMLRVNVSAREFSRPELPDLVNAALIEAGLEPGRLCLEMTETALMDKPELAMAVFDRLTALGVQSAIDDFGTGYSSLSYLKRFPVNALKIDKEFVDDIVTDSESYAIVESILHLAAAMSMEVVAEGVETFEQVELLRELGCQRAQGYLVSSALAHADLGDFVRQREQTLFAIGNDHGSIDSRPHPLVDAIRWPHAGHHS